LAALTKAVSSEKKSLWLSLLIGWIEVTLVGLLSNTGSPLVRDQLTTSHSRGRGIASEQVEIFVETGQLEYRQLNFEGID
jgi:hypothetical protein